MKLKEIADITGKTIKEVEKMLSQQDFIRIELTEKKV